MSAASVGALKPLAVVAVGGNALIRDSQHTGLNDQYDAVCASSTEIVEMIVAGWNVVLTLLTCGTFGLYLFYQLVRRDRDHIRRRYDLLDAANTLAWQLANEHGLAEELRPAFERNAVSLATLQRLTTEFRDPVIWLVLALVHAETSTGVLQDLVPIGKICRTAPLMGPWAPAETG